MDYQLSNGLISLRRFCKAMKLAMKEDEVPSPPLSELFEQMCRECFLEDMLDPSVARLFGIRILDGDVFFRPEDHAMSIHCFVVNELTRYVECLHRDYSNDKTKDCSLMMLANNLLDHVQKINELALDTDYDPVQTENDQKEYLDMLCVGLSEIEIANARRFLRKNGYIDINAINRRRELLRKDIENNQPKESRIISSFLNKRTKG